MTIFRNSTRDGTKFFLTMTKFPLDDILERLFDFRIRESDQFKTVVYTIWRFIRSKRSLTIRDWRQVWKRNIEQNLRSLRPEIGEMNQVSWLRDKENNVALTKDSQNVDNGKVTDSVRMETNAVSGMMVIRPLLPELSTPQVLRNALRTRSPRDRSPSGKMARLLCKDYLKGTCTTPFCEKWHCLFD